MEFPKLDGKIQWKSPYFMVKSWFVNQSTRAFFCCHRVTAHVFWRPASFPGASQAGWCLGSRAGCRAGGRMVVLLDRSFWSHEMAVILHPPFQVVAFDIFDALYLWLGWGMCILVLSGWLIFSRATTIASWVGEHRDVHQFLFETYPFNG